jgi:hypothetical protein
MFAIEGTLIAVSTRALLLRGRNRLNDRIDQIDGTDRTDETDQTDQTDQMDQTDQDYDIKEIGPMEKL